MSKRKRVSRFTYLGLGFPVELRSVELVQFRDAWAPNVKLNSLAESAFVALATKPANLTGNEVKFVRHRMRSTLQAFSRHFRVTHQAVMKWERAGDAVTGMGWGTEVSVRLAILDAAGTSPRPFLEAYRLIAALTLRQVDEVVMVHDPEDPDLARAGYEAARARKKPERAARARARLSS